MRRYPSSRMPAFSIPSAESARSSVGALDMKPFFRSFAQRTAEIVGSPASFLIGLIAILVWALTGPAFHYSDTWQLVINTGTTIVTFLMVFLIQNTQNRDAKAVHLKLDELIRAVGPARNHLVDLEKLSDDDLKALEAEFEKLRKKAEGAKEEVEELKETAEGKIR